MTISSREVSQDEFILLERWGRQKGKRLRRTRWILAGRIHTANFIVSFPLVLAGRIQSGRTDGEIDTQELAGRIHTGFIVGFWSRSRMYE